MADRVESDAVRRLRRCALVIDQQLVQTTPVDTGRARSNWLVGVDAARTEVVEPRTPANTMLEAAAALNTLKPNQTVTITNNLPYIGRLNEGWSAQAPAGFVERAIAVGRASIDKPLGKGE